MSTLNKDSRIPLYYQLMEEIIRLIQTKELNENEKLPSERELCETYDVSRTTVRQTMMELKKDGYIYVEHGKGSFVSPTAILQDIKGFYSFTDELKQMGKQPSSQILSFEQIVATDEIASKLGIVAGLKVYKLVRLRLADNMALMYEETYMPEQRFIGLTRDELEDRSLYEYLKEAYQLQITGGTESLGAVGIPPEVSSLLQISEGTPSIKIERITFEHNQIIEYTKSITKGDQFTFRIDLKI